MTTFFFVRHGLTAHTGNKLSGWLPDVHLTEEGERQADALSEWLAEVPIKAVYASPIERTMETARPIATGRGLRVVTRPALGEVRYGKWTNRSFKVLTRTKLWTQVMRFPSAARFPEGESLRETQARALAEVERIREDHRKDAVCCVSHAEIIRLVVAHYLGVHIDLFQRIAVDPASITVVRIDDDGPRVLAVNQLPHRPSRV